MRLPTATSPFGTVTGNIPADDGAPHAPSQWRLARMLDEADRKFEAARRAALEERFERACAFNHQAARERHANNLVQMPRRYGFKTPI